MTVLIIIGIYLTLLVLLGVSSSLFSRGTKKDYMVASHSIGPFLLLMSIFGTTMTAFALIGSTGDAYQYGIGTYGKLASSSGIIHSLCFFVIGVKLWTFGHKYGYTTQIQFFRDRLDSNNIGIVLFPILVGLVVPYILTGIIGSGALLNGLTLKTFSAGTFPAWMEVDSGGGLPKFIGAPVICLVVLIYVFFGGMRATAWANAFQTIIFMVLGCVMFSIIANNIASEGSILANMQLASSKVDASHATRKDMSQSAFLTYMFIPLSVGMFPHLFQHWLTAKKASNFKLTVVAHPIFIFIVWFPCILLGIWATTDLVTLPPPVAAAPNKILPFMVKQFSGDAVLYGNYLIGFLGAGVLAAIMSSLDSQFLCLGTLFTEDIVTRYAGKDRFSDKSMVLIARCFIVAIVIACLALSFSTFISTNVFILGVWCFSGFSSLFPLVFAALYWKGLTKYGAYACIIASAASWLYLFKLSKYGGDDEFTIQLGSFDVMPVAIMITISTLAMVIVSLITPKPSPQTIAKFFPESKS